MRLEIRLKRYVHLNKLASEEANKYRRDALVKAANQVLTKDIGFSERIRSHFSAADKTRLTKNERMAAQIKRVCGVSWISACYIAKQDPSKLKEYIQKHFPRHERVIFCPRPIEERIPRVNITAFCRSRGILHKMTRDTRMKSKTPKLPKIGESAIYGSYIRGAEFSGDLDLLFNGSIADYKYYCQSLGAVWTLSGDQKHSGFIKNIVDGALVKIDVFRCDDSHKAPFAVFLIGSAQVNRQMRGHFKAKGYTMNQYWIYRVNGERLDVDWSLLDYYQNSSIAPPW